VTRARTGFRYVNEIAGALVLLAVGLLVAAMLQAGVLREWANPPARLVVLLPPDGVSGLSAGSEVELLGTRVGEVRRIVVDPEQRMHAEVALEPHMRAFVRSDSQAVIRRRFGVAGAAFLDISRGTKDPLDWGYAVIAAVAERAPTEGIGQMIDELRTRILPILADMQRAIGSVAAIAERINDPAGDVQSMVSDVRKLTARVERGEGTIGRLLGDDTMARELEATLRETSDRLREARAIVAELAATTREATLVTRSVRQGAERSLQDVTAIVADIARATPRLPDIARNVEAGTATLPEVLAQTSQTALELERLLAQLRGHWLLGGGAAAADPAAARRQPAQAVRP
jgi:phospholipid/cholesterol/gamma-HCH transport system substrate-binding protein